MGRLESSVTRIEATVALAALPSLIRLGFDVGPAMPAFFRLALTTVAVKSLLPNFPHDPLVSLNNLSGKQHRIDYLRLMIRYFSPAHLIAAAVVRSLRKAVHQ